MRSNSIWDMDERRKKLGENLFSQRRKEKKAISGFSNNRIAYDIHRNPVRAEIVKRLSSFKWSSYRAYAYGDPIKQWLNTELILSQFLNVADQYLAYREVAQNYSKEEQRICEDLRHGIILGTKKYVQKI